MMAKGKQRVMVLGETKERGRHGHIIDRATGVAVGSPIGRLVQSPAERLAARKSISPRMHTASQMIRRDFEIGVMGARDSDGDLPPGIRCTAASSGPGDMQIDAMSAYKRALRVLGEHVAIVVVWVCCYERDVSACAEQMRQDRQEVMGVLKAGLKTLADHYHLTGRDDAMQDIDAVRRRVA